MFFRSFQMKNEFFEFLQLEARFLNHLKCLESNKRWRVVWLFIKEERERESTNLTIKKKIGSEAWVCPCKPTLAHPCLAKNDQLILGSFDYCFENYLIKYLLVINLFYDKIMIFFVILSSAFFIQYLMIFQK